ncbi:hypothetical protein [Myroides sp. N17-2]|uniref:hypothetical protein n=1 Tax=Myroides sp. N17-2 TaxID=2030799 RepID=UPI0013044A4A|nr:hypothetical protein [Myroides sp. N17-2]
MKATKTNIKTNKLSDKGIVKVDIALVSHTFKVLTEAEVNQNRSSKYQFITF